MADLRFGTFLAPNIMPLYEAVAAAVGAHLGLSTELVVEDSYESCLEDINDVCFVCSLPYVTFEREGLSPAVPIAAPVLAGSRFGGKPIYFSDVIVNKDSPARSFLDLRGCSWAYNEPLSQSGYGITRYHLVNIGETNGFFGEVIEAGFHETSIQMVRDGEVDGSAIDCHVLGVAMRDDEELREKIRVIDSLGPSTIQPVAVSKRLPMEQRLAIQRVLTDFHNDPTARTALDHTMVDRFVAVDDSAFDDIREMLEACERAGFMEIK